jgi:hypothetical protein
MYENTEEHDREVLKVVKRVAEAHRVPRGHVGIIGLIAYWVPTLAASSNRHRNRAAIGTLNLFLGWIFDWVGSFMKPLGLIASR